MTFAPYFSLLGVLAGYIIARLVPDETGWYPKYFRWSGIALILAVAFFPADIPILVPVLVALLAATGLYVRQVWLLSAAASVLAFSASLIGQQVLLVALIPSTGYLYSSGLRWRLLWFGLMPIIIFALQLLFV